METIKAWKQYDEYYQQLSKEWIHTAYENFQKIISELYDQIHVDSPDFYPLVRRLKKEVSFLIEQGQPNVLKYYLKSFQIHSGKEFVIHLKECVKWFMGFQYEYDLPYIFDSIDKNKYDEICKYLNNYGDIDSPPLYVS